MGSEAVLCAQLHATVAFVMIGLMMMDCANVYKRSMVWNCNAQVVQEQGRGLVLIQYPEKHACAPLVRRSEGTP